MYADGNPYVGPDAVVNGVFARLGAEWEYWRLTVEDMLESGDKVVAFGRYAAQNKETGKIINAQFVHLWTVADGKAARFQHRPLSFHLFRTCSERPLSSQSPPRPRAPEAGRPDRRRP